MGGKLALCAVCIVVVDPEIDIVILPLDNVSESKIKLWNVWNVSNVEICKHYFLIV